MTSSVHYLNIFLGIGTIIFGVATLVVLAALFFGPRKNKILDYIDKHFLVLGFLISLSASVFPLVYSEIVNFLPCYLCWWQRVFMFPVAFLFAVALWHKDRKVIHYALPLLCAGTLVSIYQNFGYYFGDASSKPCDASGVSCYKLLIPEFGGHIQIPLMALAVFFTLLTLLAVAHFYKKD